MAATLADVLVLLEGPAKVTITHDDHEYMVELIDEAGLSGYCGPHNGSFFLAGFEHGPTHLIFARSWESAREAWIDELPPIAEDDLIEAYGVVDRDDIRDAYAAGHGDPPAYGSPEWRAWHDGLRLAQTRWLRNYDDRDNPLDLVEGYEYQSNSTGTGIVDVGHYDWLDKIDPSEIGFEGAEEKDDKHHPAEVVAREVVAAQKGS